MFKKLVASSALFLSIVAASTSAFAAPAVAVWKGNFVSYNHLPGKQSGRAFLYVNQKGVVGLNATMNGLAALPFTVANNQYDAYEVDLFTGTNETGHAVTVVCTVKSVTPSSATPCKSAIPGLTSDQIVSPVVSVRALAHDPHGALSASTELMEANLVKVK